MKKITRALTRCALGVGLLAPAAASGATFNGNDLYDIFVLKSNGQVSWYESDGTAHGVNSVRTMSFASSNPVQALATGILNGNDRGDLILGRQNSVSWLEWDGATATGTNSISGFSVGGRKDVEIADFDGDGLAELWTVSNSGNVSAFEHTGSGNNLDNVGTAPGGAGETNALAVGDLDGDGLNHLLLARASRIQHFKSTGASDGSWTNEGSFLNATNYQALTIGDFDGNGLGDVFRIRENGDVIWSEGPNLDTRALDFASNATSVALADLNADGTPTLLIGHADSAVSWWEYDADLDAPVNVGGAAIAGDGALDIAVFPVPEPGTLGLLSLGALAMLRRRR